jgi:nicotine blue oxidoreductase
MPGDRIAGVLLAAGGATRFGSDKLAAELGGRTLLQWSATAMIEAGLAPVLAVVRPGTTPPLPPNVTPVANALWRDGLSASVRAGLAALRGDATVNAAVVAPADQPWCRPEVFRRLIDAFASSGRSIVMATFDGAMRNPVLLTRDQWTLAEQIRGDIGLSAIARGLSPLAVECGDVGSPIDVDTPADLERARAVLGPAPPDDGA